MHWLRHITLLEWFQVGDWNRPCVWAGLGFMRSKRALFSAGKLQKDTTCWSTSPEGRSFKLYGYDPSVEKPPAWRWERQDWVTTWVEEPVQRIGYQKLWVVLLCWRESWWSLWVKWESLTSPSPFSQTVMWRPFLLPSSGLFPISNIEESVCGWRMVAQ